MPAPLDWLSRFLQMVPVSGRLEIRCSYGAPWRVAYDEAISGEMPYHIIVSGEAILENPNGAKPQKLLPGDILLLPHGSEHVLHDGSGKKPSQPYSHQSLNVEISENKGKGQHLDMLCGRFVLSPHHNRLIRTYFPATMIVRGSSEDTNHKNSLAPSQLRALIEMMRAESMNDSLGGSAILSALSAALFALILRVASEAGNSHVGLLALAAQSRLAPALNAMFNNPRHSWSLEELADLSNMSRATVVRQFRENVGRSAAELLTDIRMTIAADALIDSSKSTDEIAEQVGYQSVAAFRRAFTRHAEVTPGEWRRKSTQSR